MTVTLRPVVCTLFLFLHVLIPSTAQQTEEADSATTTNRMHSRAILFHIWSGTELSYATPLSEQSGLRLSAKIDFYRGGQESRVITKDLPGGKTTDSLSRIDGYGTFFTQIALIYFGHISLSNRIYGYAGIGPLGSYSRTSSRSSHYRGTIPFYPDDTGESRSSILLWGAGLQGVIGIQAFVTSFVSVFGEMELSGLYTWRTDRDEDSTFDNMTRWEEQEEGWNINTIPVKLGIGIHF